MSSTGNIRMLAVVFVIVLLVAVVPARVAGQNPPTWYLWVTYVNATPVTTNAGDSLEIIFRVVYFCCDEAYLGTISRPADGIKSATFLFVSVSTQQSHEYPDTPVFPTGNPGEYRATVQIVPDDPTGKVWVYVKGNSLRSSSCNCTNTPSESVGPPGNTASEQTYDTSDLSLIQIGQPPSPPPPSPWATLVQGNELLLIALAAIILLLLAISLLARRRGKPPTPS